MKVNAPRGACDTHIHCYDRAAPAAPGAAMPGHFPPDAYRELQERLGLSRVIVVQPNAYREDNTVTLAAMKALGSGAKGVAVVSEAVPDAELERLTHAGIVAQRFFNLPAGTMPFSRMQPIMARVHPFGWHANLQLDGRELPRHEAQIRRLPGKFVIDHNGKYLEPVSTEHESFIALKKLLDTGRCWVKLSAPYETSRSGAPKYEDVSKLARALVKHAPERMLWASNWPHPSVPAGTIDDQDMLDLLADWAPSERDRQRILVDNPAELYGF